LSRASLAPGEERENINSFEGREIAVTLSFLFSFSIIQEGEKKRERERERKEI